MGTGEWAPDLTSVPVSRALLLELGLWTRRIAEPGAWIALPGRRQSVAPARNGTG